MNRDKKILTFTVLTLIVMNIVVVLLMQFYIQGLGNIPEHPTAMATSTTSVCINQPPNPIVTGCNFTIPWGYAYNCSINTTDNDMDNISYYNIFLNGTDIFNISINGLINFTPNRSMIGNYTVRFFASDNTGCSNGLIFSDFNISVLKANHAPYLAKNIPNQSINYLTSVSFFLNDYFLDPDGDNLTYVYLVTNTNITTITIAASSQVVVKGLQCGINLVSFVATDPYNLTAISNPVKITVTNCPSSNPVNGKGGTGGGGGGSFEVCVPDWNCDPWSKCRPDNTSELICRDYKQCNPSHYIEHHYQNCTYVPLVYQCEEKWNCTQWSACLNNTQTRDCLDMNSCGTNLTLPPLQQQCSGIASCFDGIQDGNETGIDCGGVCAACKNIQQPARLSGVSTEVLIVAALTLIIILVVLYSLRKSIAKLWNSLTKSKRELKKIYFDSRQKELLLQTIYLLQTRFEEEKYKDMALQLEYFVHGYFRELLGLERPDLFSITEALLKLKNKDLDPIIIGFYSMLSSLRLKKPDFARTQAMLDEILSTVYLVSEFTEKDALICVKERDYETHGLLEECYLRLSNLYIAMEFEEIKEVKKLYGALVVDYEKLTLPEKQLLYKDLVRAYNAIRYISRYL